MLSITISILIFIGSISENVNFKLKPDMTLKCAKLFVVKIDFVNQQILKINTLKNCYNCNYTMGHRITQIDNLIIY